MNSTIDLADRLSKTICKIKCLSFFIETQNPDHSVPLDFDEIQYGLSLLLGEITKELSAIKNQLD